MDPALLKERELFKRKAMEMPIIERKKKDDSKKESEKSKSKPSTSSTSNVTSSPALNSYKTASSSQYKFGVLAKIVKYMKTRHQQGDDHPLSLNEILDETNQLYVTTKIKQWLETEALPNNVKIDVTGDNKFIYKPPLKIRSRKALLNLLIQHDLKGLGGILLEDVQESLPHCEKALKHLQHEIIYVTRPDKKQILFYKDKTAVIPIEEEFQKLWRSVPVENMDDEKINEYLEKQGIKSMQDHGIKRKAAPLIKRKKPNNRNRQQRKPRDNEHMADVLENYTNLS